MDSERKVLSEPFVLEGPDGWARFPCAECDNDLAVGDEVVMVEVDLVMVHPAHRDRRKCRTSAR